MSRVISLLILLGTTVSACVPTDHLPAFPLFLAPATATTQPSGPTPTPIPIRPNFSPGELVDYIAQSGDTLPALAARFNTSVAEIMAANPIIPADATTMPPGFPMKIPIYYRALWANAFKILPDAAYVDGPATIGFNTSAFVAAHPGWWKNYVAYAGGQYRTGAEIVDYVATNYSISPRLLLAILEYESGALSQPARPPKKYILDYEQPIYESASNLDYLQLVWAGNVLNNGYYGWRAGNLTEFDLLDGTIIRPDPWQNAGSVAIQYFFAQILTGSAYQQAVSPDGLARTYENLFGDAWTGNLTVLPGSLSQPKLLLPFPYGQVWTFTGGPHTGWGLGEPFAAVDFAPPSEHHGCFQVDPQNYILAVADGLVVRSSIDGVALDLDGDGDERTGWVIFYLHVSSSSRPPVGKQLHAGDIIGYPSCEGGEATGTHVHLARKYNGEWILADGPLAFNLGGWIAHDGKSAYLGTLTKNGLTVRACQCSDLYNQINSAVGP